MAEPHPPHVKRVLDSLKKPVPETSEDIHPDHFVREEKKTNYVELARTHAASPPRHWDGTTKR